MYSENLITKFMQTKQLKLSVVKIKMTKLGPKEQI